MKFHKYRAKKPKRQSAHRVRIEYHKKVSERLEKADPHMFEHFADYQLSYEHVKDEIINNGHETEFELLEETDNALKKLETTQEKLQLIGENLRDHKFRDYDWRYITTENDMRNLTSSSSFEKDGLHQEKRYFLYSFPVPALVNEYYDISDDCNESLLKCIDKVYEAFR